MLTYAAQALGGLTAARAREEVLARLLRVVAEDGVAVVRAGKYADV